MFADFRLFGIEFLNLYVIFIAGGIVAAAFVFRALCSSRKIPFDVFRDYLLTLSICVVFGFVFAMLVQSVFNWIASGFGEFRLSGLTFIGGLLGGIAVFALATHFLTATDKSYLGKIVNLSIICIVLAHAFGRLGCFSVGCCYGVETDSFIGVVFPAGSNPWLDGHTSALVPTQLIEALFLFALFGLLVWKLTDFALPTYLIGYGTFRFVIEFWRGDDRGELLAGLGLSPSQLLSIGMLCVGVAILVVLLHKNNRQKQIERL